MNGNALLLQLGLDVLSLAQLRPRGDQRIEFDSALAALVRGQVGKIAAIAIDRYLRGESCNGCP